MTEYDYSPEAFERHIATQRRISRWVDNTERHRFEFHTGQEVTPPVPPAVYGDDYSANPRRRAASRDPPGRPAHRRHSSSTYPAYGHAPLYASPPITPQHSYPLPGPMPFAPQIISPPQSRESRKSRRSATAYVVTPPPPVISTSYYQYPYPYAPGGYPYMAPAGQAQPTVLPIPANGTPQNTPYYNPHPSQPLRVPPYQSAVNPGINALKPHQLGDVSGAGPLGYTYSTPLPYATNADSPSPYGKIPQSSSAAMQYLPPHVLYQRLHEIGRARDRRRTQSTGSSDSGGRGRSASSNGSSNRSRSRGRSRTRKPWWNFT
ncbi:hypothetical protein AX15_001801 [Amanita polypyramis BW_CC]|nr:hypothetical protein AX15_001801 [Amanita polypyramis BW_CC]